MIGFDEARTNHEVVGLGEFALMGFAALYPSYKDSLGLFNECGLHEMLIEGIGQADPEPLHYHKRDAVGKRIVFVLMLNEIEPARVGWVERSEPIKRRWDVLMGFGFRLYPSYNGNSGRWKIWFTG